MNLAKQHWCASGRVVSLGLGALAMAVGVGVWAMVMTGRMPAAMMAGLSAGSATVLAGWCFQRLRPAGEIYRDAAEKATRELRTHSLQAIQRMMPFIEAVDRHWKGHSSAVGQLAARMARQLGVPESVCEDPRLAGELHDIGMVTIPEAAEPRKFGCEEFRRVSRHSDLSYELLKPILASQAALMAIRHHHERMNGTGYPAGLSGQNIPLPARMMAVADAYDAMTHDRPHRSAMSATKAMAELRRCTPEGFDPECVAALAKVLHIPEEAQSDTGHAAEMAPAPVAGG